MSASLQLKIKHYYENFLCELATTNNLGPHWPTNHPPILLVSKKSPFIRCTNDNESFLQSQKP